MSNLNKQVSWYGVLVFILLVIAITLLAINTSNAQEIHYIERDGDHVTDFDIMEGTYSQYYFDGTLLIKLNSSNPLERSHYGILYHNKTNKEDDRNRTFKEGQIRGALRLTAEPVEDNVAGQYYLRVEKEWWTGDSTSSYGSWEDSDSYRYNNGYESEGSW